MAKDGGADIFMTFRKEKGDKALLGECTTELTTKSGSNNDLLNGFEPPAMFEISKFDFGVGANQTDVDEFQYPGLAAAKAALAAHAALVAGNKRAKQEKRPKSLPGQTLDDTPVTVQPIGFSRKMDTASPLLLYHTINQTYFKRVAIIKRKSAGGVSAGEAYLRMDFEGVILIEANWSNDDPVTEDYSFHARAITMRYKPQLPDGTLGAAKVGFWSLDPKASEATL